MAKISKHTTEAPVEHPDDRAVRIVAEARAKDAISAFVAAHQQELAAMIQTYADADAEGLLVDLREKFWASM